MARVEGEQQAELPAMISQVQHASVGLDNPELMDFVEFLGEGEESDAQLSANCDAQRPAPRAVIGQSASTRSPR